MASRVHVHHVSIFLWFFLCCFLFISPFLLCFHIIYHFEINSILGRPFTVYRTSRLCSVCITFYYKILFHVSLFLSFFTVYYYFISFLLCRVVFLILLNLFFGFNFSSFLCDLFSLLFVVLVLFCLRLNEKV